MKPEGKNRYRNTPTSGALKLNKLRVNFIYFLWLGRYARYREHFTEKPESKILETYPKFQEILSFYPPIFVHL